jgi:hypothetical protein
MRTRTGWKAWVLLVALALTPTVARAQDVPVLSDPEWPVPLYSQRPERGGFYFAGEFIYFRQTNPIKEQVLAIRGFNDVDGIVQAIRNTILGTSNPVVPGAFFGSGMTALDTIQVSGQGTYAPGFGINLGYRFSDGSPIEAINFRYRHVVDARYSATASILPPFNGRLNFNVGTSLENTFLFSPVYNFPAEFAGPSNKIAVALPTAGSSASVTVGGTVTPVTTTTITGNGQGTITTIGNIPSVVVAAAQQGGAVANQAAFGIWNGASLMTIDFTQRFDDYELIGRIPIYQNDCCRFYGLIGPRHSSIWERFKWRTVDIQTQLPGGPATANGGTITTTTTSTTTGTGINSSASNSIITTVTGATATAGSPQTAVPGDSAPDDQAIYSNVVSNQLWGPIVGYGLEYYMGHGFACSTDLRGGVMVDFVREIARYEIGGFNFAAKHARRDYSVAPEIDGSFNLNWYPIAGVQVNFGYDLMLYFNTVASPKPVDFNYGSISPGWEKGIFRYFDGFKFGVAFIF